MYFAENAAVVAAAAAVTGGVDEDEVAPIEIEDVGYADTDVKREPGAAEAEGGQLLQHDVKTDDLKMKNHTADDTTSAAAVAAVVVAEDLMLSNRMHLD